MFLCHPRDRMLEGTVIEARNRSRGVALFPEPVAFVLAIVIPFTKGDNRPTMSPMMIEYIIQRVRLDQRRDAGNDEESGVVEEKGDATFVEVIAPEIFNCALFSVNHECLFFVSSSNVPARSDVPFSDIPWLHQVGCKTIGRSGASMSATLCRLQKYQVGDIPGSSYRRRSSIHISSCTTRCPFISLE